MGMQNGKSVLISGAASGIGAATARVFGRRGWAVGLIDSSADRLGEVANELEQLDVTVIARVADVRDEAQMQSCVAAVADRFAGLTAVCANAGIAFPEAPLSETSDEIVRSLLDVNVRGAINLLRAAVPRLAPGGAVVLTSSTSGFIAHPGAAVYAATKLALVGLGRSLAMELADRGVRVNMVCPGGVDTALTQGVYQDALATTIAEYEKANPLGRIAQPDDIAEAIAFLASAEARHVNGVALRVDGGDGLQGVL